MKNEVRPIDANALARKILYHLRALPASTAGLTEYPIILSMLRDEKQTPTISQLTCNNVATGDPLTQADLDKMDFDKVWISYGPEPDNGEEALVYNGRLYSINNLEGAGFGDMLNDLMRGDVLDNPSGAYVVYRSLCSPERIDQEMWKPCEDCHSCGNCSHAGSAVDDYPCAECISDRMPNGLFQASMRYFHPVGFCQSCGRPLTQAAWAALKKRLMGDKV